MFAYAGQYFEGQITQSYIFILCVHTRLSTTRLCQASGALSPCLYLSLQFFNNQDDFTEDFTLFDIKLVLCTVACLFSLYALLYDYFIAPMPDSWPVLLVCSVRSALFSVCVCDTLGVGSLGYGTRYVS